MMNGWSGMGVFGGFGMLLGTLVVIAVVAWILWGRFSGPAPDRDRDRPELIHPLEILNRRYAAGEISAAEFTQAKQVLGVPGAPEREHGL